MSSVPIEQKSYELAPREGFTVSLFITVADIERSAHFYEKVFGGRILSKGDSKGAWGTSKSRIRGSSLTSGAAPPRISRR